MIKLLYKSVDTIGCTDVQSLYNTAKLAKSQEPAISYSYNMFYDDNLQAVHFTMIDDGVLIVPMAKKDYNDIVVQAFKRSRVNLTNYLALFVAKDEDDLHSYKEELQALREEQIIMPKYCLHTKGGDVS